MRSNQTHSKWFLSAGLFLLALLSRLPDLGRFLTADEFLWVDRSRNFLAGLTNPAYQCTTVVETWEFAEGLACTLRTGHPGVTTMWTGSFGFILRWLRDGRPQPLHDYVVAISTNPLDPTFIVPERLGTVLLTSLWVVAVYWLVRRLMGAQVALIGAVLIALDPFHIALSRVIHHDALSTTFITLSVLCMFIYWGQQTGRRWLLLSGALAGLGFLSKSPALYLMPFVALVGFWFAIKKIRGTTTAESAANLKLIQKETFFTSARILIGAVIDGLIWFAMAVAIFFVFWPAMWVIPVEAVETVFFIGSKYATGGHAKGNYFLGTVSNDPGALFYPISWLFRASPLVLLGLVWLLFASLWLKLSRKSNQSPKDSAFRLPPSAFPRYLPLILLFILGYYLLMTIGEKKQERYFLPVYPWINLIAAAGLGLIVNNQLPIIKKKLQLNQRLPTIIVAILLINGLFVVANFPYYFTYYNPLLGGITGAEKVLTIGWGEGLDLAADYLNRKENVNQTRVASWYQSTFAPYYAGSAISYSKEKGKVLAGDYAVFYINQTQRRFPDDVIFDYFAARFEPEKTINLHGLDYAWIYPSLGVDHYIQDQTYTGIASLLAWQWQNGDPPLIPGQPAEFELYWEYLGKAPEESFFFRLVDSQGRPWAEGESRPVAAENPPVGQWRMGEIIFERGAITPPRDMPPGQYQLQIGFYTKAEAVTGGELLFEVPEPEALITMGHAADHNLPYVLPIEAVAIDKPLEESLTLLGVMWPEEPLAVETTFDVDLYWQVEQPLSAEADLHLGLMDAAGEPQQAWFNLSLAETFNNSQATWQSGDVLRTRWRLTLLPEVPPGVYYLEVVWPDDVEQTLAFGQLIIREE